MWQTGETQMMERALEIACKHYNRAIDLAEAIENLEEIIELFCIDAVESVQAQPEAVRDALKQE
jgi:hypothetical protein